MATQTSLAPADAFAPLREQLLAAAEAFASDAQPLGELLAALVDDVERAAAERLVIFLCHTGSREVKLYENAFRRRSFGTIKKGSLMSLRRPNALPAIMAYGIGVPIIAWLLYGWHVRLIDDAFVADISKRPEMQLSAFESAALQALTFPTVLIQDFTVPFLRRWLDETSILLWMIRFDCVVWAVAILTVFVGLNSLGTRPKPEETK